MTTPTRFNPGYWAPWRKAQKKGGDVNPQDLTKVKLVRNILWASSDGLYVVVEGPFPHKFLRSADATTVAAAAKRSLTSSLGTITHRGATESPGRYAKTL